MNLKITLASCNGRGAVAGIESPDDVWHDEINVAGGEEYSAADACREAAAALRVAARRFEILADVSNPRSAAVQDEVNSLPEATL